MSLPVSVLSGDSCNLLVCPVLRVQWHGGVAVAAMGRKCLVNLQPN